MAFSNLVTWGKQQFQPQQQPGQQQGPQQGQMQHPQEARQNPQQQPGQQNPNGSGGPAGSQMQGPANSTMNPGGNPANPLDPFLQLMTPSKEVLTQQQQEAQMQNQGLFGDQFNPEAINGALKNTNFANGLDPAKMQAALGGDVNAFMEVLNSVSQNAVSTAIQASKGMVEHGVKTGTERFGSSLDSRIRNYSLKNQNSSNPALQHPLGKALLGTVTQQIATANPKLSPEEVRAKGEEMFTQFAQLLTAKDNQGSEEKDKAPDWEAFLQ